jgi:hypothetical protein
MLATKKKLIISQDKGLIVEKEITTNKRMETEKHR